MSGEFAQRLVDHFAPFPCIAAYQDTPLKDLPGGSEVKAMLLQIGVRLGWIPLEVQLA